MIDNPIYLVITPRSRQPRIGFCKAPSEEPAAFLVGLLLMPFSAASWPAMPKGWQYLGPEPEVTLGLEHRSN